jgi:hypothetical protein
MKETDVNSCEALGKMREARALLLDEAKTANSRELALVKPSLTKRSYGGSATCSGKLRHNIAIRAKLKENE